MFFDNYYINPWWQVQNNTTSTIEKTNLSATSKTTSTTIPVEKTVNTSLTNTVASTMRARSLVITVKKMKPKTTLNVFLSNYTVNKWFMPCSKIQIPLVAGSFVTYANSSKQPNNLDLRTTTIDSYDILDRGDVIKTATGGSAVVIADEVVIENNATKRYLYVANVIGSLQAGQTIVGQVSGVTTTITAISLNNILKDSVAQTMTKALWDDMFAHSASYTFSDTLIQTNSIGNMYGILIIPTKGFPGGIHKLSVNDTTLSDPINATTMAENSYSTHGNINTFSRATETTNYVTNTKVTTSTKIDTSVTQSVK